MPEDVSFLSRVSDWERSGIGSKRVCFGEEEMRLSEMLSYCARLTAKNHRSKPAKRRPAPRFHLEPLEPRVLLSSDLAYAAAPDQPLDATLRLYDDGGTVIVRFMDNTSGTVLESPLAETSSVAITGSNLADRLTIDLAQALGIPISFDGGSSDSDALFVTNDYIATIAADNSSVMVGSGDAISLVDSSVEHLGDGVSADFLSQMNQLSFLLGKMSSSLSDDSVAFLDTPIPFAQNTELGDLIDLSGVFEAQVKANFYDYDEDGNVIVAFSNLPELKSLLQTAFGNVDQSGDILTFEIDVTHEFDGFSVPIDFRYPLSPLSISESDGKVTVDGTASLDLTINYDLVAGLAYLSENNDPADPSVSGTLTLTSADISTSEAIYGFLGITTEDGTLSTSGGAFRFNLVDPQTGVDGSLGDIYLGEVSDALKSSGELKKLIANSDVSGSITVELQKLEAAPDIFSLNTLLDDGSTIAINLPDIDELSGMVVTTDTVVSEFGGICSGIVISAFEDLADYVTNLGILFVDEALPMFGASPSGIYDYFSILTDGIDSLSAVDRLQELEAAIEAAFGLEHDPANPIIVLADDGTLKFELGLMASQTISDEYILYLSQTPLTFTGDATLDMTATAALALVLGIDLADPSKVYVYDDSSLDFTLRCSVSDLESLCGVSSSVFSKTLPLTIQGGTIELGYDSDGNGTIDAPVRTTWHLEEDADDGRYLLAEVTMADSILALDGQLEATLPVHLDSVELGDIGLEVPDLNEPAVFSLTFPDLNDAFDELVLDGTLKLVSTGLKSLLSQVQGILDCEVFNKSWPLIGDQLVDAVQFVRDINSAIIGGLDDFSSAEAIRDTLNGVLSAYSTDGPAVTLLPFTGEAYLWKVDLEGEFLSGTGQFAFDLGLPGLGMDIQGDILVDINWNCDFTFGLSLADGLFIVTEDDIANGIEGDAFWVEVAVTAPDLDAKGTLGFLELQAVDQGSVIEGRFLLDLQEDGATGAGNRLTAGESGKLEVIPGITHDGDDGVHAYVDLALNLGIVTSTLPTSAFPSFSADFVLEWTTLDPSSDEGSDLKVSFNNVAMDLGSFFSEFASPILGKVQDVLAPFNATIFENPLTGEDYSFLDVLRMPIPVISDLIGGDDEATGMPVTLLDIARASGVISDDIDAAIDAAVFFLEAAGLFADIDFSSGVVIQFGSFDIIGNQLLNADSELSLSNIVEGTNWIDQVSASPLGDEDGIVTFLGQLSSARSEEEIDAGLFAFPFLNNPASLFNLFVGKDVDLFYFDLPEIGLEFEYGHTFWVPTPILIPVPIRISGEAGVSIDLAFGFDTYGLRIFAQNDYQNPMDILSGFYVSDTADPDGTGPDVPEITFSAGLAAGLGVDFFGVMGGVFAEIRLDLDDPFEPAEGKVRASELLFNLEEGYEYFRYDKGYSEFVAWALSPIGLFNTQGELFARLYLYWDVPLIGEGDWDIVDPITLLNFEFDIPRDYERASKEIGLELAGEKVPIEDPQANVVDGEWIIEMTKYVQTARDRADEAASAAFDLEVEAVEKEFDSDKKYEIELQKDYSEEISDFYVRHVSGDSTAEILKVEVEVTVTYRQVYYVYEWQEPEGEDDAGEWKKVDEIEIEVTRSGVSTQQNETPLNKAIVNGTGLGDGIVLDRVKAENEVNGMGGGDHIYLSKYVEPEGIDPVEDTEGASLIHGGGGVDYIYGGTSDDEIYGDAEGDYIWGHTGNDTIYGDRAKSSDSSTADYGDYIYGEAGNDIIYGDGGGDHIYGDIGEDELEGNDGEDWIWGGENIDHIWGGADGDHLYGGGDDDVIRGNDGDDEIEGNSGNDYIEGNDGEDDIQGNSGNDEIHGNDDDDTIDGGGDNDLIFGEQGSDVIEGSEGFDVILGDSGTADFASGYNDVPTVKLSDEYDGDDEINGGGDRDWIYGQKGEDTLEGGSGDDMIYGGYGVDHIYGEEKGSGDSGTGNDYIEGERAGDWIWGNGGNDTIHGDGEDDHIYGNAGNDDIYGEEGSDTIDGGSGVDVILGDSGTISRDQSSPSIPPVVNLSDDFNGNDVVNGGGDQDWIYGQRGDDTVWGDDGDDIIEGNQDNDIIYGNAGSDLIYGMEDDDILIGDDGDASDSPITADANDGTDGVDTIYGQEGDDKIFGGGKGDFLYGDINPDGSSAGSGRDIIIGDGGEISYSSDEKFDYDYVTKISNSDETIGGNDTIKGNDGTDIILAGLGGDEDVQGNAGNDIILGDNGTIDMAASTIESVVHAGDGKDTIYGQEGEDKILGGGNDDELYGDKQPLTGTEMDSGNDIIIGDGGTITYKLGGDRFDFDDVTNIGNRGQEYGGSETIEGNSGDDIILGGPAGDPDIQGNSGNDTILGDNGEIVLDGGDLVSIDTRDEEFGGADTIQGNIGDDIIIGGPNGSSDVINGNEDDDIILGDNGLIDFNADGDLKTLDLIRSENDNIGGDDFLYGNDGEDVIMGGKGGDTIDGDEKDDIILGDNGEVNLLTPQDHDGEMIIRGGAVVNIHTTDTAESHGGADTIDGGTENDIILGGVNSGGEDTLNGNTGNDVILGDNGQLDFAADGNWATLDRIESEIGQLGGTDIISGNAGMDVAIGGTAGDDIYGDDSAASAGDSDGEDILLGDNGTIILSANTINQGQLTIRGDNVARILTTDILNTTGGVDNIEGNAAGDVILGGVQGDRIYGDRGYAGAPTSETIDNDGDDVILGDNGELDCDAGDGDLSTLDIITSYLDGLGGVDTISGNAGYDVLIGGTAGDEMYGDDATASSGTNDGEDIMLGDNADIFLVGTTGRLIVLGTAVDLITTTDDVVSGEDKGGADTMSGNAKADIILGGVNNDDGAGDPEVDTLYGDAASPVNALDLDDILIGDNGLLDFTYGMDTDRNTLDLVRSFEDGMGGIDILSGNAGADVAIGGTAGDTIYGDDSAAHGGSTDLADILLGDNADIFLKDAIGASGGDIKIVLDAAVYLIRSTDEEHEEYGGSDTISGNADSDIIAGGVDGDTLYGDAAATVDALDSDDIMLGDNAALEWLSNGRLAEITGIDIAGNNPALYAKYGSAAEDTDLTTLDLITTEQSTKGARDLMYGDAGQDLMFGGTDADEMHGDDGDETGDSGNNDLMFGDHGRMYPQFSMLSDFNSRNFFAIDIENADEGEGDQMWGEEGDDTMVGQQGDDRMFGGSGDDDMTGGHNVSGGIDEMTTPAIDAGLTPAIADPAVNNVNDLMDGGSGNDLMAGDNAIIWRRGNDFSPRFRELTEDAIYTTTADTITLNIGGNEQSDPDDAVGRDIELVDHSDTTASGLYGADVMAGGEDSDVMFGQLANDLMQGDGFIGADDGDSETITYQIAVTDSDGDTDEDLHFNIPEAATDADDYMEGSGGDDLMYGGLGQDDMIGGSSSLFGLTTEPMRPDGFDYIFGGAGIAIGRNDIGATTFNLASIDPEDNAIITEPDGHARDADFIMGDNANIYRLVEGGASGTELGDPNDLFLTFNYDNYGTLKIIPRGMEQLDYNLGGADYNEGEYVDGAAKLTGEPADNGAADLIHGESGDDIVFGMTGSDVIFGEGQDDSIVGGYGHDWISGGTGQDGILGDDGLIYTSRNSTSGEPLYGIGGLLSHDPNPKSADGNVLDEYIRTPGEIQSATINISGELKKTADLVPFSFDQNWMATDDEFPDTPGDYPYADDIIFGGLGNDWLHGGSGDDAISGAEALEHAYVPDYYDSDGDPATLILDLGYEVAGDPTKLDMMNPGGVLAYNSVDLDGRHLNNRFRPGEFALYDEYDPRRLILLTEMGELSKDGTGYEFLLNFAQTEGVVRPEGTVEKATGQQAETYPQVNDDGDDAIFGDLGNDWLVGGTGRDNMYGGWGNDLLNADDDHSTNGDLNDRPDTHPTYEDRAYGGAGRDVLIGNTGGDRLIDWVGEYNTYLVPYAPFGMASVSRTMQPFLPEFLYALSASDGADPTRATDTGADSARNGEPDAEMGLIKQKDVAWQGQTGAPADPQAGNIPGGKRDVLTSSDFNSGTAELFAVETGMWSVSRSQYQAQVTRGGQAISLLYVNEQMPSYYEILAAVSASKDKNGYYSNGYIIFDYYSETDFKFAGIDVGTDKLVIGQRTADGWVVLRQSNMQLREDTSYNLMVAVNGTNVTLVVNGTTSLSYTFAPRVLDGMTYGLNTGMVGIGANNSITRFDNVKVQKLPPVFTSEVSEDFSDGVADHFVRRSGLWGVGAGSYFGAGIYGMPAVTTIQVGTSLSSYVQFESIVSASRTGGLVFDYYSDTDFKFVVISEDTDQIIIGHRTDKGWYYDAVVSQAIGYRVKYKLSISLHGGTVSVSLDNRLVSGYSYNSVVTDGDLGYLSMAGAMTYFDDLLIRFQV